MGFSDSPFEHPGIVLRSITHFHVCSQTEVFLSPHREKTQRRCVSVSRPGLLMDYRCQLIRANKCAEGRATACLFFNRNDVSAVDERVQLLGKSSVGGKVRQGYNCCRVVRRDARQDGFGAELGHVHVVLLVSVVVQPVNEGPANITRVSL